MSRSTDALIDSSRDGSSDELRGVVDTLRQFQSEEHARAQEERDERRRAWHDGRASAFQDALERLVALLPLETPHAN